MDGPGLEMIDATLDEANNAVTLTLNKVAIDVESKFLQWFTFIKSHGTLSAKITDLNLKLTFILCDQ